MVDLNWTLNHVDAYGRIDQTSKQHTESGTTVTTTVTQTTYDELDRVKCTAVRMNPAVFGSLPSDACTLGTTGSFGPDRITKNTYDAAGQLLTITRAYRQQRLCLSTSAPSTTEYTVNGLNRYKSAGSFGTPGTTCGTTAQVVTYDCNGNLTRGNVASGSTIYTFTYDVLNRLTNASGGGMSAIYTYDALGRRTQKAVTGGSFAGTADYLDSGDDEIAEYDHTTGNLLRRYIPGPVVDRPIALAEYTSGSEVLSFFYIDRQGSVVAMADSGGNKTEGPYTYDAYGQCQIGSSTPCTGGVAFKYIGRRIDPETGLYYYRARYYAPAIGRFLQTDPVGYKDDLNWYAYVTNDPMNAEDPTGEASQGPSDACKSSAHCDVVPGNLQQRPKNGPEGENSKAGKNDEQSEKKLEGFPSDVLVDAVGLFFGGTELKGGILWLARALGLLSETREIAVSAALTKAEARVVVKALGLSESQSSAALSAVGRATTTSSIDIAKQGSTVIVRIMRAGRNGYQVMESRIGSDGTKTVVQRAFNSSGELVHYDPKTP